MWAQHRALLALREVPTVPAPVVVAQSWRDGALPARLLAGCDVDALDDRQARSVGSLAARTVTGDIADAGVVEGARLLTPAGDFRRSCACISPHPRCSTRPAPSRPSPDPDPADADLIIQGERA
jgi:hypothetical protein